jgi:AcrR family transcriptional regulator
MLAFWKKGFVATSITELCDAMKIRPPSLYAAFGSKESLYIEAVKHYVSVAGPLVWGHLADALDARSCVKKMLLASIDGLPGYGSAPAGCMVSLAGVSEECPAEIAAVTRKTRLDGLELLRERFKKAQAQHELPPSTDIERLSRFYLGVYQGIAIQARDGAKQSELAGIVELALAAWPEPVRANRRKR